MCKCKNIEMGSHDAQVVLKAPEWSSKDYIAVDECIAEEILFLWSKGVQTAGSCCGHNKIEPMINVFDESFEIMDDLGYKYSINKVGVRCYKPLINKL